MPDAGAGAYGGSWRGGVGAEGQRAGKAGAALGGRLGWGSAARGSGRWNVSGGLCGGEPEMRGTAIGRRGGAGMVAVAVGAAAWGVLAGPAGCGTMLAGRVLGLVLVDCDGEPVTVDRLNDALEGLTTATEIQTALEEMCITDEDIQFIITRDFPLPEPGADQGQQGQGDQGGGDQGQGEGGQGEGGGGIILTGG